MKGKIQGRGYFLGCWFIVSEPRPNDLEWRKPRQLLAENRAHPPLKVQSELQASVSVLNKPVVFFIARSGLLTRLPEIHVFNEATSYSVQQLNSPFGDSPCPVLLKWLFWEDRSITLFDRMHQYSHYGEVAMGGLSCHVCKVQWLSDLWKNWYLAKFIINTSERGVKTSLLTPHAVRFKMK